MGYPRQYKVRELTKQERERLNEVRFFLFYKLLKKNHGGTKAQLMVKALGDLAGVDMLLLSNLLRRLEDMSWTGRPSPLECSVLLYRSGEYSLRQIQKATGHQINFTYSSIQKYIKEGNYVQPGLWMADERIAISKIMKLTNSINHAADKVFPQGKISGY